jgi:hypothetical protein
MSSRCSGDCRQVSPHVAYLMSVRHLRKQLLRFKKCKALSYHRGFWYLTPRQSNLQAYAGTLILICIGLAFWAGPKWGSKVIPVSLILHADDACLSLHLFSNWVVECGFDARIRCRYRRASTRQTTIQSVVHICVDCVCGLHTSGGSNLP